MEENDEFELKADSEKSFELVKDINLDISVGSISVVEVDDDEDTNIEEQSGRGDYVTAQNSVPQVEV